MPHKPTPEQPWYVPKEGWATYMAKRRAEHRKKRLCLWCKNKRKFGRPLCEFHLKDRIDYYYELLADGLCAHCTRKRGKNDFTLCAYHREKRRVNDRARYARRVQRRRAEASVPR